MQITLGRKGDYSVRAVLDVARAHGVGRRKTREIAEAMDLPERYLPQILANLAHHGILQSTAGPDGGYTLTREPGEITLLEVVESAEGPIDRTDCVLRSGPCDWTDVCAAHDAWARVQGAVIEQLRGITFAELSAVADAIEAGTYRSVFHPATSSPLRRTT